MPQLDAAAVPIMFHGAPSYLSTLRTPIRTSPSKRKRLAQEHEECLQENRLDIQKINGYQQFTTNIEMRIRTEFPAVDLVVRQYDSHILVYTLSDAENINRERKLMIRGLLRLFTGTRGVVSVKEFVCSFSDIEKGKQDTAFILHSHIVIWTWKLYMCLELLMVTGFIAKKQLRERLVKVVKLI